MINDNKKIALVNQADEIIGFASKLEVHKKGLLHRAFSVLVFNDKNEVLLQKRAASKYHSPGMWSNTCCSHFIENFLFETYIHERLFDEMGFDCELEFKFSFHYKVAFENGLSENEIDHVFFGKWNGIPKLNPAEADDYKWITINDIKADLQINPNNYSYWFKELLQKI